ncbi:MAG TPA: ribose-phosphate pyrophosphokinase [Pyrinomonadaceae bacterium]|jgi:ribose-phosphate pyrophosphokinase
MKSDLTLFAGTANQELARGVARELGVDLGECKVERFPDGELSVRLEEPVRGREVFVVQPTSPPVNENLMELLAFADACRRASSARVTAVVPYFGYARADKRDGKREPVTASMVADLMQTVGIGHVVTVDVHTPQIEGFFRAPLDNLTAVPALAKALRGSLPGGVVVVSPDAGRVRMASEFAQRLQSPLAVLHKRRESGTKTRVTHMIGEVSGRACLIVDDMISTGGTIAESVAALLEAGASPGVRVVATHGLFVKDAREKMTRAGVSEVWTTDSVAVSEKDRPQLHIVSIAPLLAGAISRFLKDESLSDLYD